MNAKNVERPFKNERLNYIVSRMHARHDITPADLASELKVSERTIYRDLRSLEKGQSLKKRYSRREGRYLLETELTLSPLTLTASEALALQSAAPIPALLDNSFLADDLRSALCKIDAGLTPVAAQERTGEVAAGAPLSENLQRPTLEMIRQAIRSNSRIRIRYRFPESESEQTLDVTPYDLRYHAGHWYLLANAEALGGIRPLALNCLRAVSVLSERFRFPRRFSADSCFAKAWATYHEDATETEVQLRFAPAIASLVEAHCPRRFVTLEPQPDGALIGTLRIYRLQEILWWLLPYGSMAEVLSPSSLREELLRVALGIASLYVTR